VQAASRVELLVELSPGIALPMQLRNQIGIDTRHGYRTFELYRGDLTKMGCQVDLLAISAFGRNYYPTPKTVIGALSSELGLDVSQLAATCELDLRSALGIWISRPVAGFEFDRILCVEIIGTSFDPHEVLNNVFVGIAVLEAKGVSVASLALPLLGAGPQMLNPQDVMKTLLPAAKRALDTSSSLTRVLFVEINPERVEALNEAMDTVLGRSRVTLPKGPLIESLRADLLTSLSTHRDLLPSGHSTLFSDMRRVLHNEGTRSFELGIMARRLVELVVDDLLERRKTSPNLPEKIDRLGELGVAPWIRGYMHTLRLLGNDEAHEKNKTGRLPAFASEEDLAICLFSIQRIWNFWAEWKQQASRNSS
jgi:hypothetical protein